MKKSNYMADVEIRLDTKLFPAITKAHANAVAFAIQRANEVASKLVIEITLKVTATGE